MRQSGIVSSSSSLSRDDLAAKITDFTICYNRTARHTPGPTTPAPTTPATAGKTFPQTDDPPRSATSQQPHDPPKQRPEPVKD